MPGQSKIPFIQVELRYDNRFSIQGGPGPIMTFQDVHIINLTGDPVHYTLSEVVVQNHAGVPTRRISCLMLCPIILLTMQSFWSLSNVRKC